MTTFKPSFYDDVRRENLTGKETGQVYSKIFELLQSDPTPDAKTKKQLKYFGGKLQRLRVGKYRVFYTFQEPNISLLALRRRDDHTYDEDIEAENLGGFAPDLTPQATYTPNWVKSVVPEPKKLPEPLTKDLLTRLAIPEVCHPRLQHVETEDDLIDCPGIPDPIKTRLLEFLYEKPLVDVWQQPDFLLNKPDDLLQFPERDLMSFLLKLNPEQEKYVTWSLNGKGATLLKGGPGTGKSTVALYRAKAIFDCLRAQGQPRILFTTYTNALVHFSRQLLNDLMGQDAQGIEVITVDKLAMDILHQAKQHQKVATGSKTKALPKSLGLKPRPSRTAFS